MGLDALILAGLNLYLLSFYVCASSEGPRDAASKHRHVLEMTDQIFMTISIKNLMSWPISFQSSHFLMKCSGRSLISDQNRKTIRLILFNGNL